MSNSKSFRVVNTPSSRSSSSNDGGESKETFNPRFTQYVSSDGKRFIPYKSVTTYEKLPAGCYRLSFNGQTGEYYANLMQIETDELLDLPVKVMHDVLLDIKRFWKRKDKFKAYKMVHKRGILLHGPPGGGKTTVTLLVKKNLIEKQDGIVFSISSSYELEIYTNFMKECFLDIEPHRPIVTIIEDIDGLVRQSDSETLLLQVLDGARQMNNIVYLATTNYPENLAERILNRPSRFDRVYEVGYPNGDVRRYYFEKMINSEDLPTVDIERWVEASKGFTFAHMRDMIVSVLILGNDFDEAVGHLQGMKNMPTSAKTKSGGGMGFNKGAAPHNEMGVFIPPADEDSEDDEEPIDLARSLSPPPSGYDMEFDYEFYSPESLDKFTSAVEKGLSGDALSDSELRIFDSYLAIPPLPEDSDE